jgi:hypothetical protein
MQFQEETFFFFYAILGRDFFLLCNFEEEIFFSFIYSILI